MKIFRFNNWMRIIVLRTKTWLFKKTDIARFILLLFLQLFMILIFCYVAYMIDILYLLFVILVSAICITLSAILLFYTVKNLLRNTSLEAKNKDLRLQDRMYEEHSLAIKAQVQEIETIRGNFSFYLQEIGNLLENEDYINTTEYSFELLKKMDHLLLYTYCKNPILNALFFHKIAYIQNHSIRVQLSLQRLHETTLIETTDLISLFSNLLDNAIESCEKLEPALRFIEISDLMKGGFYIIRILNSKPAAPTFMNGELLITEKKDASAHGLGSLIIKNIANKYNGTARFHDQGNTFLSIVSIEEKFI